MFGIGAGFVVSVILLAVAGSDPVSISVGDTTVLRADRFGSVSAAFVCFVTLLVQAFARRSLAAEPWGERFFPASALVGLATVVVALAASWWAVAIAWLAVSAATVMVLGHDGRPGGRSAARSARRTFFIGDLAVLSAAAILTLAPGANSANGFASRPESTGLIVIAGVLLVIAAATRGALPPFHGWLRRSVDAPTPVSALLHAGVVNGGGILLIRGAQVVGGAWVIQALALVVGLVAVVGGVAVMRTRSDVKGALIWSTIAQMGFMTVQCALGLFGPAIIHLVAHGMFKAYLFLESGSTVAHTEHRHAGAGRKLAARPLGEMVAMGSVGALAVGAALLIVRPEFVGHGAGWLPVVLLGVLSIQSAVIWGRRQHSVARSAATAVGLALIATGWLALADGIESAVGLGDTSDSTFATIGALVVLLVCLGGWAVSARLSSGRGSTRWVDQCWLWAADFSDPHRRDSAPRLGHTRTNLNGGQPT